MFLQLDRSKQSTPAKFHPRNSNQKASNQEIPPRRFPCIKQQSSTYQTDLRIPPKNRQHKALPPRKFHRGDSRRRTASKVHPQNSTQDICETRGFHHKNSNQKIPLQRDRSKQSAPEKFHPRNSNPKPSNQEIPSRRFACIKHSIKVPPQELIKEFHPRKGNTGDFRQEIPPRGFPTQDSKQGPPTEFHLSMCKARASTREIPPRKCSCS